MGCGLIGTDIAIDLGTAAIKFYLQGKGLVINEPAVVAVNIKSGQIIAVGKKAYSMVGKTSEKVAVVGPMRRGVISDFAMAEYLIQYYLNKVGGSKLFMPRIVVSVPCEITEVEKRAVVDAVSSAGVRKVCLLQEPIAAAMGAGIDIAAPRGSLVVDVGAGTTDMAVISLSGISSSRTVQLAGDNFDDEIMKYVRRKHNLIIGKKMAEQAKVAIGCVYPRKQRTVYRMKGSHSKTGMPHWADVTSDDMLAALLRSSLRLIRNMQGVLEQTPPELLHDIYEDGIVLTGASSLLYGFDKLVEKKMKLPVRIAYDADICVALGAGKALEFIDKMEHVSYGMLNPLSVAY